MPNFKKQNHPPKTPQTTRRKQKVTKTKAKPLPKTKTKNWLLAPSLKNKLHMGMTLSGNYILMFQHSELTKNIKEVTLETQEYMDQDYMRSITHYLLRKIHLDKNSTVQLWGTRNTGMSSFSRIFNICFPVTVTTHPCRRTRGHYQQQEWHPYQKLQT